MNEVSIENLRDRLEFRGVKMKVPSTVRREFRRFRGEEVAVDATGARSAIWLTAAEAELFGVKEAATLMPPVAEFADPPQVGRLAFANFWHDGENWVAVVQPSEVQNVIVQQEIFLRSPIFKRPLAAHGQIRFIFREGAHLELHPQEAGQAPYAGRPVDDIVVSAEAARPQIEGFPAFDLIGGAKGWFRQSMRFISTEDKAERMMETGHTVHQFLLHLQGEEPQRVFLEAVRRANEIGLDMPYNLLAIGGTQCVYEMFNILDRSVVKRRKKPGWSSRLFQMFDRMPLMVGQYLSHRGLRYTEPTGVTFPTLNEEWAMSEEAKRRLERKLERFGPCQGGG
jgi:hypothetical protein